MKATTHIYGTLQRSSSLTLARVVLGVMRNLPIKSFRFKYSLSDWISMYQCVLTRSLCLVYYDNDSIV